MLTLDAKTKAMLDSIEIGSGSHARNFDPEAAEKKLCIMETAAFIAGLPVNENPVCSSATIVDFMIGLNDTRIEFDHETYEAELAKLKQIVPEVIGTCPTQKGMIWDWNHKLGEERQVEGTIRNETKGYQAAEGRRRRALLKEMKALGLANLMCGEVDSDDLYDYELDYVRLSTEDGIRIARIMIGIKNRA